MINKVSIFLITMILLPKSLYAQFVSQEAEMQARGSIFSEQKEEPRQVVLEPELPPAPAPYKYEVSFKIAAIVNGELVTAEDINNRIRAFSFSTQIPLNYETIDMVKNRVIQNTIDEKIKLQEAAKEGIIITDKEAEESISGFAANINMTTKELYNELKGAGVSIDVFKEQMKSDLAWIRLIRKKTSGEIEPSQKEINKALEQMKKDSLKERYMISEIVINKKNARNLSDLVSNLRNDPRFGLYAMQFSESPSSSKGGNLGWIAKGKLYPQLENAISKMKDGDVSDAILVNEDYYIIKLEKRSNPEKDKLPSQQEIKSMIEGKRMEDFANTYLNRLRQKSIIEMKDK